MGPVPVAASHQRAALRPPPSASTAPALPALRSPKLLNRLRERIRLLHYSRSTEQAYVYWRRSSDAGSGLLGVSVRTLQGWEQGRKQPSGAARTLLAIASTNPKAVLAVAGK